MLRSWLRMLKGESQDDKPQSPLERYKTPYLPEFGWSEENDETEMKMIALVSDTLDEQLDAFREEYLAHIEAITNSDSAKEASPTLLAFSLGQLSQVVETLSETPQAILERVHAAFDKDGVSTLTAYFHLYAGATNYDALVLERANALMNQLFQECYRRVETSYVSLTENEAVLLKHLFMPVLKRLNEHCLLLYEHRWNVLVLTLEHHNDKHSLAESMEAWVRAATRLHSRDYVSLFREVFLPPYLEILEKNDSNQLWASLKQKEAGRNFEPTLRAWLSWDDANEAQQSIVGHFVALFRELENTKDETRQVVTPKVLEVFDKHRQPLGDDYFYTLIQSELDELFDWVLKSHFVSPTQELLDKC